MEETPAVFHGERTALPWPQRRDLAERALGWLRHDDKQKEALSVLQTLSRDAKWEVRKAVADGLLLVPGDEFPGLAAALQEDSNAFVRKAAERACRRRGSLPGDEGPETRGMARVRRRYSALEKRYGRAAAEQVLEVGECLYDVLVGSIVHDMRGILTPLKNRTSALLRSAQFGDMDRELFRTTLTKVRRQVLFMERLFDDIKEYSRPDSAERTTERLADVVHETTSLVLEAVNHRGLDPSVVKLQVTVPDDITIEAARHQVVSAVGNVLKNAYESFVLPDGRLEEGEIRLEATEVAGTVRVTVTDTGIGMDPEDLEAIREFVPGSTSKKHQGTGFGLPIARRRVQDHGGSIEIDSELEVGTKVTLTFPPCGGKED